MYIEKIFLNDFGGIGERNINFDSPFTVLSSQDPKELQTIEDAISIILFGISPDKRSSLQKYVFNQNSCSASLLIKTEREKKYLIGRDFIQERLEIFEEDGMRLISQPATVLMDLLCAELGTLNPLDFEAIFHLKQDNLEINQNALGIREEFQKILKAYQDEEKEMVFNNRAACTLESVKENNEENNQEELSEVLKHLDKLERKINERKNLEKEIINFKKYEVFLSQDNKNQIEVLSQQLTTLALERKYLEEQIREHKKIQTTLEQEKKCLQNKIMVFEELFSPERQKLITKLIKSREEKNIVLKKLESEYSYGSGKKGLLSRRGKERGAAEEKMNNLLKELSNLRTEIEEYLQGRTIDKYLNESVEYKENKETLIKLQQSPTIVEGLKNEEELNKMVKLEKETRKKLEKLLLMAGSNDLKALKKKINTLVTLKERLKNIEQEIHLLSGDYEPLEAIKIMKEKITHLQEIIKANKEEVITRVKQEKEEGLLESDPLLRFYVKGYEYLKRISQGKIKKYAPEFTDGKYKIRVFYEDSWCDEESLSSEQRDVFHFVLRMSMARLHAPAKRFPYIINNLMSRFTAKYLQEIKEDLLAILQDFSSDMQIIYLADSGDKNVIETCLGDNNVLFHPIKQV